VEEISWQLLRYYLLNLIVISNCESIKSEFLSQNSLNRRTQRVWHPINSTVAYHNRCDSSIDTSVVTSSIVSDKFSKSSYNSVSLISSKQSGSISIKVFCRSNHSIPLTFVALKTLSISFCVLVYVILLLPECLIKSSPLRIVTYSDSWCIRVVETTFLHTD